MDQDHPHGKDRNVVKLKVLIQLAYDGASDSFYGKLPGNTVAAGSHKTIRMSERLFPVEEPEETPEAIHL